MFSQCGKSSLAVAKRVYYLLSKIECGDTIQSLDAFRDKQIPITHSIFKGESESLAKIKYK